MALKRSPKTISVQGSKQLLLPEHLSHSSRELLLRCAKSWFLKYMTDAPWSVSLWTAIGSAVHEATEYYDRALLRGDTDGFDAHTTWAMFFGGQLEELRRKEPNQNSWRFSPSEPLGVWNTLGPQLVQSWIDWRQRSPYTVWITPDGEPAIELDVSGMLPGCPVEIKGYVDIVMEDPTFDQLLIIDKKTSKRPPASVEQFATYAALLEVKYGRRARLGAAFMNRKGTLATPWDLGGVTPQSVGAVFGEAWEQITAGEFPATGIKTNDCYLCDTSSSCYAKGGPLSAIHDPADPSYPAPF
jgi:putative RecB family exonuclease